MRFLNFLLQTQQNQHLHQKTSETAEQLENFNVGGRLNQRENHCPYHEDMVLPTVRVLRLLEAQTVVPNRRPQVPIRKSEELDRQKRAHIKSDTFASNLRIKIQRNHNVAIKRAML